MHTAYAKRRSSRDSRKKRGGKTKKENTVSAPCRSMGTIVLHLQFALMVSLGHLAWVAGNGSAPEAVRAARGR